MEWDGKILQQGLKSRKGGLEQMPKKGRKSACGSNQSRRRRRAKPASHHKKGREETGNETEHRRRSGGLFVFCGAVSEQLFAGMRAHACAHGEHCDVHKGRRAHLHMRALRREPARAERSARACVGELAERRCGRAFPRVRER